MKFSEAVKKIRWDLRLSQKKLADALDTAQTVISEYESGKTLPNYLTYKKLEKFAKENNVEVTFE